MGRTKLDTNAHSEAQVKSAIATLCDFLNSLNPERDTINIKHITIFEYQQRLGKRITILSNSVIEQNRNISSSKRWDYNDSSKQELK